MKRSKLYRARSETYERANTYALGEAVELLKQAPSVKFDETVELAFRLGIDTRQSDQAVRGAMVLPHGTGKSVRVVVIADDEAAQAAKEAGADEVGSEELLDRIKGGWLDFDVLLATPAAMKQVRALGRVLGPRGLMPNPKTGTVTEDTAAGVRQAKAGRIEYRADKGGCVHAPVGRLSFSNEALVENAMAVTQALLRARPATTKGAYLLGATLCSTMSPGIRLNVRDMAKA